MDKEYLESFGIAPEVAAVIMEEHQKVVAEHEKTVKTLKRDHAVAFAVQKAGGRNLKAVTALLDADALGEENFQENLETALGAMKKENPWLFETSAPPRYAPFTGADTAPAQKPMTLASALRERMRK